MITFATYITIIRILLIPMFVTSLLYYSRSAETGELNTTFHYIALASFFCAAVCDALDGFIARTFHQISHLGSILDPLADKALMLSAIITLSMIHVDTIEKLPLWFTVLILSRDFILIIGFILLHSIVRHYKVEPHWSGKLATLFQVSSIVIILLPPAWLPFVPTAPFIWAASIFTAISIIIYLSRGIYFIRSSGHYE